jgi:iron complex transport system substrate-binding protein
MLLAARRVACIVASLASLLAASAAATLTVTDDSGARVELAQPARRIVSLAPHLTEQLYAVGAGARIVGTTDFADYPPPAQRIERVGRAGGVDLERIAALKPDLIVVWGSGFAPATLAALRRLGTPVFVSEPAALADVANTLRRLGRLTGGDVEGPARAYEERVAALRAQYAGRAPVRVFYQVWASPLMTLAGRHVVGEAIALCGGVNVFAELAPLAPTVSVEAVLARDPQLIVTAEAGGRPGDALSQWQRFPALAATRGGHFATLYADRINRSGPRLAEEIGVLCAAIEQARARPATR